ncbi:hypothetical protein STEG23_021220 [Scotinomys teguina]
MLCYSSCRKQRQPERSAHLAGWPPFVNILRILLEGKHQMVDDTSASGEPSGPRGPWGPGLGDLGSFPGCIGGSTVVLGAVVVVKAITMVKTVELVEIKQRTIDSGKSLTSCEAVFHLQIRERLRNQVTQMKAQAPGFTPGLAILQAEGREQHHKETADPGDPAQRPGSSHDSLVGRLLPLPSSGSQQPAGVLPSEPWYPEGNWAAFTLHKDTQQWTHTYRLRWLVVHRFDKAFIKSTSSESEENLMSLEKKELQLRKHPQKIKL